MVNSANKIEDDYSVYDDASLFEKIDKGISDMEAGKLTPHNEAMKIIIKRFEEIVLGMPVVIQKLYN